MIKLCIAQLNFTVGDIQGNVAKMQAAAQQASAAAADMVVFSELALTGYYPGDLLDDPPFLERVDAGLAALMQASKAHPALHWVVGTPTRRPGAGKPLNNSLLVVRDGAVLLRYAKQLLPTYNVFDERRHFEPGPLQAPVMQVGGTRIGFLICEDGWNDASQDYAVNPFEALQAAGPDVVVSINASPSDVGKRELRHRLFSQASRQHGLPMLYVNQVGGQDQLVYDGASFAVEPQAGVVFEAKRFGEDFCNLVWDGQRFGNGHGQALPVVAPEGLSTMAFYQAQIVLGLQDYARRCGFSRAVVGSSGGIDSALTLALAAQALGPQNVDAVTLPSDYSSPGSVDDSKTLCANLGVRLHTHPIAATVQQFAQQFAASFGQPLQGVALENLQARVRGTVLMEYSNSFGHLLLTTGNKSEIAVGYCTLYGDTNGGLGLIGDLYKTEAFALARHLNAVAGRELIPQVIIDKEPSAELAPNQKDADSLPPYPVLDEILKLVVEGERLSSAEQAQAQQTVAALRQSTEGRALMARVRHMVARSEYKRRQAAPIIRVRARAFGAGRQMPIAAVVNPGSAL